jgi:hypothetical protein
MIQSPTEILEKARRIRTRGHISIDEDSNMMFIPPDLKKSRHGERNRMKYITQNMMNHPQLAPEIAAFSRKTSKETNAVSFHRPKNRN